MSKNKTFTSLFCAMSLTMAAIQLVQAPKAQALPNIAGPICTLMRCTEAINTGEAIVGSISPLEACANSGYQQGKFLKNKKKVGCWINGDRKFRKTLSLGEACKVQYNLDYIYFSDKLKLCVQN